MPNQCVPEPELERFIFGNLDASELQRIAKHVDHCEPCQDTVVALAEESNTFVETIRNAGENAEAPQEGALKLGLKRMLASLRDNRISAVANNDERDEPIDSAARIGPYQIEEQLGHGGMGHVYRAMHTKLKRVVALKVLPASRWANSAAVSRFEREMEAIGGLDHPNIVRASDAGEDNGMHFLVMEYIDGLDLSQLVNRLGQLPVADACEVARQSAIGLHHAHERGLVHRDVKPSNLMLAAPSAGSSQSQPTLKILDLGLALLGDEHLQDGHELTTVGTLMGTLDYMSPEQGIDSHSVDQRTDIYSLGATLFKLLTGRAPYADPQYSSLMKKMTALATKPAPSIGDVRSDLPTDLIAVIDKMLSRDPDERFESAEEVAAAMVPFAAGADIASLLRHAMENEEATPKPTQVPVTSLLGGPAPPTKSNVQQTEDHVTAASSGRKRTNGWLVALAFAFAAGLCGVLFYMATDVGTLRITSEDPNASVLVKRSGKPDRLFQIKNGEGQLRLWAGKYQLVVQGDAQISVEPNEIEIKRNDEESAKIKSKLESADGIDVFADVAAAEEATRAAQLAAKRVRRERLSDEASQLEAKGDFKAAIEKYNEALAGEFNPRLLIAKANVLSKLGWSDEASGIYATVQDNYRHVKHDLSDAELRQFSQDYASAEIESEQYERAITVLRTAGRDLSGLTDPESWYLLGVAQRKKEKSQQFLTPNDRQELIESALKSFKRTLQLDPDHEEAATAAKKIEAEFAASLEASKQAKKEFLANEGTLSEQVASRLDDHRANYKLDKEFIELLDRVRQQRPHNFSTQLLIRNGTTLRIVVRDSLPEAPIADNYVVNEYGTVLLGSPYGQLDVGWMTVEEARLLIEDRLSNFLKAPKTEVYLVTDQPPNETSQAIAPTTNSTTSRRDNQPTPSGPVYKQFDYAYWLNALRTDRDPATQRNAMEALGVLGAGVSFEAATEILKATREAAGSRVGSDTVAEALSALEHEDVVTAIKEELRNGNDRSREYLNGILAEIHAQASMDKARLHAAISKNAAELTNLRFAHSTKNGDEADAELGFLLLMFDQFDIEPKEIRDILAENVHRFPVNREQRIRKLTNSVPDLPGLAERIISQTSWQQAFRYANWLGVENVRPVSAQLLEKLRSLESNAIWVHGFNNQHSDLLGVLKIVGDLENDGVEAIPTLTKIVSREDVSETKYDGSVEAMSAATIALAKLNALKPSNAAKKCLRGALVRWQSRGEKIKNRQRAGDHKQCQEVIEALESITAVRHVETESVGSNSTTTNE